MSLVRPILVIHVNNFSRKIEGGYLGEMYEGKVKKISRYRTTKEIIQTLVEIPDIQVEFLKV